MCLLYIFVLLAVILHATVQTAATTSYIYQTDGTPASHDALLHFADLHAYVVEPLYNFTSPYYVVQTPTSTPPPRGTLAKGAKLSSPLHVFAAANNHVIHVPFSRKLDAMVRYSNPYAIPYVDVPRNFYVPSAVNRNAMHLNAAAVNYSGAGIRVYIPDGGMQCDHAAFARPDKKAACDAAAGFSCCADQYGSKPEGAADVHATMCASVICASKYGGGVAPGATCVPRRYICNGGWSMIGEARANAVVDPLGILSVSNGPPDGIHYYEFPPPPLVAGIVESWGRGAVRVDAAGNGALRGETCAADWTVSLQQTPGIAAVSASGLIEPYSEHCPGILLAAFGATGANRIYTALADASSTTLMTDLFDGTSAAAPQVAGVLALMREANRDAGPRDLVRALIATARREGLVAGNAPFLANGAGFTHSLAFGFGYPDAAAAIAFLQSPSWHALPPQRSCEITIVDLHTSSDDAFSDFSFNVPDHCTLRTIEYVNVRVSFLFDDSSAMGELALVSPSGRRTRFLDSFHGYHIARWDFFSGGWPFYGESPAGSWTLSVEALDDFDIAAATLTIYGIDVPF